MNINIPNKVFVESNLETLQAFIRQRFDDATSERDKKASRFTDGYRYYLCLAPRKEEIQTSGYVEPIVRKAVDKVMPSLLNIFTENEEQAVIFRPTHSAMAKPAVDAVNRKINDIFLRENNGYNILTNAIREALIVGDTFIKVYVEEDTITEELDGTKTEMPVQMLALILQEFPDTNLSKIKTRKQRVPDPDTGEKVSMEFLDSKLLLERKDRKVKLDFVPYDEVYLLADTFDIKDTRYICHKMTKTVGQLVDMGFDKEDVMCASSVNTEGAWLSTKDLINDEVLSDTNADNPAQSGVFDPMEREVSLYEHYIWTSVLDKKGKSKLYQVFAINTDKILEVNEVSHIPFAHGVPDRIPGSFWGTSFYDTLYPYQDFVSNVIRDQYQVGKLNTYQRVIAVKNAYNKATLLNGYRPGAVIEVEQPGAIQPYVGSQTSPDLVASMQQVLSSAQDEMMNAIGNSLDPGAISNIAATTMSMAIHNAEMKDKKIAKSLAYTLIRPLFELIYATMRKEDLAVSIVADGQVVEARAGELPERSEFYIDVNTANDDAMQAAQLSNVVQMVVQASQVPSQVLSPVNLYNVAGEILKSANIHNIDDFITNPLTNQPTPEQQQMEAAMAEEQRQANLDLIRAQTGVQMAQQAKFEVEASELIRQGAAERKEAERKMLLEMERLEVDREYKAAMGGSAVGREQTRRAELEFEMKNPDTNITISK